MQAIQKEQGKESTLHFQIPRFTRSVFGELSGKQKLEIAVWLLIIIFLLTGTVLQTIDPTAGVLDIGILSVLLFGLLVGIASIFCSLWLQEILWQPFKTFRKQFHYHFNQLTSWQQCIIYFSVFFLSLYAILWGMSIVL